MKKLILLMLVAVVPYFTMAQKRTKKAAKKVEKVIKSNAKYDFMIITGYEVPMNEDKRLGLNEIKTPHDKVKQLIKSQTKVIVQFDLGTPLNRTEEIELNEQTFKTMAAAVNGAATKGWEFHSSNVLAAGDMKIHYYYMRRDK